MEAFAEKYDTYADIYGDPVGVVFKIMADSDDEEVRLRAADMLMSYRYPRIKAAEGDKSNAPPLTFNVLMPAPQLPPQQSGERLYGVESGYASAKVIPIRQPDKSTDGLLDE